MSLSLNFLLLDSFLDADNEFYILNKTDLKRYYIKLDKLNQQILFLDAFRYKRLADLKHNLKVLNKVFFKKDKIYSYRRVDLIAYIKYIINVRFFYKNLAIYTTDNKGILKASCSVTSTFKSIRKIRQLNAKMIFKLLDYFLDQLPSFSADKRAPVALHLKSVPKTYFRSIVKKIRSKYNIQWIHYYSLVPHNGCRLKKKKRIKQRKKKF